MGTESLEFLIKERFDRILERYEEEDNKGGIKTNLKQN
jgi:hypothetical protein